MTLGKYEKNIYGILRGKKGYISLVRQEVPEKHFD